MARAMRVMVSTFVEWIEAVCRKRCSERTARSIAASTLGTRTTVDVLDARRNLFEAQRDYARSRYDYVVNALLLKQAAGNLGAGDLEEVDGWLTE